MDAVEQLLAQRGPALAARILVTLAFWMSGITKLLWWQAGIGTMVHFNLVPPVLFNAGTILLQLVGSALIISGKKTWIGALILAVFTLATIPLGFPFWSMVGPPRGLALDRAYEHLSVIGGLLAIAILSAREKQSS
jgi:transmembrane protein